MNEYDRLDASLYDSYATGPTEEGDIQFYVAEARSADSPVLELGCGTGRILIPVAEAGVEIVGLDLAPAMLAVARHKIARLGAETQGRIRLVEGDMRDFSLGQRFNLIMIPFRAFHHLLTPEDQRLALGRIREHLAEKGRLVFNIFDPRLDLIAANSGPFGAPAQRLKEFTHPETAHRVVLWHSPHYDPEGQICEDPRVFEELDADGKVVARTHRSLILRYVHRYEMQHLLELCGFKIEALYGDFRRGPFRYGGEQVWVAY